MYGLKMFCRCCYIKGNCKMCVFLEIDTFWLCTCNAWHTKRIIVPWNSDFLTKITIYLTSVVHSLKKYNIILDRSFATSGIDGIICLFSGNDLARVLKWGGGYQQGEDLFAMLNCVLEAEEVKLDRSVEENWPVHS